MKTWKPEHEEAFAAVYASAFSISEGLVAVASCAVELHEAGFRVKGGTLEAVEKVLAAHQYLTTMPPDERVAMTDAAREEISALSARVAALELARDEALKQATHGWDRHAEKDRAYGAALEERDAALARVAVLEAQVASERKHADRKQAHEALTVAEQRACPSDWNPDASLIARDAHQDGAEAMRAACLHEVDNICNRDGIDPAMRALFKAAIEGATP